MTNHERPGVYSAYDASSVASAKAGGGAVAIVAAMEGGDGKTVYRWYSCTQAAEDCGAEAAVTELGRLALKNGAGMVYAIPVGEDYTAGFATLETLEQVTAVVSTARSFRCSRHCGRAWSAAVRRGRSASPWCAARRGRR